MLSRHIATNPLFKAAANPVNYYRKLKGKKKGELPRLKCFHNSSLFIIPRFSVVSNIRKNSI
jgi:hypothetical protein